MGKTQIICSQVEGLCVSSEGSINFCYGSMAACPTTSSITADRQCRTNGDCARFNVAGAPRFSNPAGAGVNNCADATIPAWAKELCAMSEHCDDDKGCERFKETLKLTDLPTNLK